MVVRGPQIGERVKYWVRPDILNRIEEGSIKAYFDANISKIEEGSVQIETPNGTIELENDWVIALTGYRPNYEFLEQIGLELSQDELKKPRYDEETMESSIPGLYLAGVICGGMETHKWFIENSRIHAPMIISDILTKQRTLR